MEVRALCFTLLTLEFIFLRVKNSHTQKRDAAFLRISPDRLQHFQFDSVTFDCVGFGGLRGIKNTKEFDPACDNERPQTSSCTFSRAYTGDSGEYWCEGDGERSNSVNITVAASPVILESPAAPVIQGDTVTLRCRSQSNSTTLPVFYKDGKQMESSAVQEMTIKNVSKLDEGLYSCSMQGVGSSPESWLAVRANTVSVAAPPPPDEPPSADFASSSSLLLLWVTVPILIMPPLLLLGFLLIRTHRASSKTQTAASLSGEDPQIVSDVTYAAVVIQPKQDEAVLDSEDAGDNLSVCLETSRSRKPQTEEDEEEEATSVYSAVNIHQPPPAP